MQFNVDNSSDENLKINNNRQTKSFDAKIKTF